MGLECFVQGHFWQLGGGDSISCFVCLLTAYLLLTGVASLNFYTTVVYNELYTEKKKKTEKFPGF